MAIIIVDNFQVDINNPIDNRFVVGSQSIPSGGTYPTPFYAYRNDIVYKYPGLRIWDFNDNVPYVWDGTQWINENTTGALVQNAATGNTGYKDYVVKFANNQTLLTKSNIFDNGTNVGIGLTGSAMAPNTTTYPIAARNNGLHVDGHIRTNGYFIGKIYADYIVDGSLNLARITPPGTTQGLRVLKNTTGDNSGTSWDLLSNIVPIPTNLSSSLTGITTGNLYAGIVGNQYNFRPIVSSGLSITEGTNEIRIETLAGLNLGLSNTGQQVYKGRNSQYVHEFYKLNSDTLKLANDGTYLTINTPDSATIPALYINNAYIPTYDEWSRYKGNNQLYTLGQIGINEYAGDGTIARPFTNTVTYTSTTTYTTSSDTAIANGIRSFLGTGTRLSPQRQWEQIVVQGGYYVYYGDFNYNRLNIILKDATIESNPVNNWLIDLDDTAYFAMNDTVGIQISFDGYAGIVLKKNGFKNSGTKWAEGLFTKSKHIDITGTDPNKCSIFLTDPGSASPNQYVIIDSNWNGGNPIGYNTTTGSLIWIHGFDVYGNPITGTGKFSTLPGDTYINDSNSTFTVSKITLITLNQPILKIGSLTSDFRDVIFSISQIGYTNLDPTMIALQFAGKSYTRTDKCHYYWFGAIPTVQYLQRGILLKHTSQLLLTSPLLNGGLTDCLVYAEHLSTTVDINKQPFLRLTNSTTLDGVSITNAAYTTTGDIFKTNLTSGKWSNIFMNGCFINKGKIDESKINLRGPYNIQSVMNNIGDQTGFMKLVLSGSLERNTFHNRGTLFVLKGLDIVAQGANGTSNSVAGAGTLVNNYSGDVTALVWRDNTNNSDRTNVQVTMANSMQIITGSGLIKTNGTGNATLFANGSGQFLTEMPVGSIIKIGSTTVGIVASVVNNNSATLVLSQNITTNLSVTTFSAYNIVRPYLVKLYIEALGNTNVINSANNLALVPVYKILDEQNFIVSIAEVSGGAQDIKIHFEAIQL